MMRSKTLRAHDLAIEICRQERLSYERMHVRTEALLCRFAQGQSSGLIDPDIGTAEAIKREKQRIRRTYIEIISGVRKFTEDEYSDFIWDVVRSNWFMEKAEMVLDSIEEMLDGQVTQDEYDPSEDFNREGKRLKTIIKKAYLNGRKKIISPKVICTEMDISKATYDRRLPDGIVLFGMLIWIYACRRELEDIEAGVVEKPDFYDRIISRGWHSTEFSTCSTLELEPQIQ